MRLVEGWLSAGIVIAALGATSQAAGAQARLQEIVCESAETQFMECQVRTGGHAQLVQNISSTRCEYERTWGFDYDRIWVDRGCRGRFRVGGSGGAGWQTGSGGRRVVCESSHDRYQFCQAETRGDVRLVRQISSDPCEAGRTWGFEQTGIWVNDGCRAEFELGYSNVSWAGGNRTLVCESNDGRYTRCRVWTYGEVRLTRQISNTRCVQSRNWGFDQHGIWVNAGCRAEFSVGNGGGGWGPGTPGAGPGGPGGGVEAQARAACQNKARATGYSSIVTNGSNHTGSIVRVDMRAMSQRKPYDLECTYRIPQRTALLTRQSEAGFGGGGGPGDNTSDLFSRASRACNGEVRRQGYEVLGSGPSERQPWGVRHKMALRRAGDTYHNAYCGYYLATGRVTLALGAPEAVRR